MHPRHIHLKDIHFVAEEAEPAVGMTNALMAAAPFALIIGAAFVANKMGCPPTLIGLGVITGVVAWGINIKRRCDAEFDSTPAAPDILESDNTPSNTPSGLIL